MSIQIVSVIEGRGLVQAVFEVDYAGLRLRGLKLNRGGGLATPGRKIQGAWQQLYDIRDPALKEALRLEVGKLC